VAVAPVAAAAAAAAVAPAAAAARPQATGWVADWFKHIGANFLAGVPTPNRATTLQNFENAAKNTLRNHLMIGTAVTGIIAALDADARHHLDNAEAGLIAGTPAPAPILPLTHDYTTPGVVCTGTPVDLLGHSVPLWVNRDAYSANHARGAQFAYLQGGGPEPLALAFAVPANNSAMMVGPLGAKPRITLLGLLGGTRHAEDGWMARFYTDFVAAVNALVPPVPLPALAGRSLWQQKATLPRVEFLLSMSPCPEGMDHEGCCRYFAQMRAALTANIPILIYYYKVWLAREQARGVQSVAANGAIVNYPNRW
jgi:hypothetical protein